ncbi:MAG: hypothetical protein GKR97_05335 [Rhizobiaceae bacterium]|nr:hypothetical protein [Rhizobiaceae bacterium]
MTTTSNRFGLLIVCALLAGCSTAMSSHSVDSGDNSISGKNSNALAFQSDEEFGRELSNTERGALSVAELQALEFGEPGKPVKWGKESDDVSGSVMVTQPFRVGQSSCRRFSHFLVKKSKNERINGTACRRQGGSWRLVQ